MTLLPCDGKSPVALKVRKSQGSPMLPAAAGNSERSVPRHALQMAVLLEELLRRESSFRTVPPLICDASFARLGYSLRAVLKWLSWFSS